MKQLIKIWLVLFLSHLFARVTFTYLGFRRIDLRFEVFVQLILVPVFQALVLWWIVYQINPKSVLVALRGAIKERPFLGTLLLIDCLLIAAGWSMRNRRWADLTREESVASYYTGLKGLAAGTLTIFSGWTRQWSTGERLWLFIFGIGLSAYGSDYFLGWLQPIPDLLYPEWPLLFRWVFVYGLLFLVSIAMLLKIETIWSRRFPTPALILSCATAFALLAATVVVINTFNKPYLSPPWSVFIKTCAFLSMSAVWTSVLHAHASQPWHSEH